MFVNSFFLSCWTNDVEDFPKLTWIISPSSCHLRFSIVVLETLKLEWQCSQYHKLNPTCGKATSHLPRWGQLLFNDFQYFPKRAMSNLDNSKKLYYSRTTLQCEIILFTQKQPSMKLYCSHTNTTVWNYTVHTQVPQCEIILFTQKHNNVKLYCSYTSTT